MTLSRVFKAAIAATAIAAGGYAGYQAAPAIHHQLANTAEPAFGHDARRTAEAYNLRLTTVIAEQQIVDNTTDEETEGRALDEAKKLFATDAVLDRQLGERDLQALAHRFNTMGLEDGIRFRAYNFDPATIARRNECLTATPASSPRHGADRFAYAQRVETCMIDAFQRENTDSKITAPYGAATGSAITAALLAGIGRRRKSK